MNQDILKFNGLIVFPDNSLKKVNKNQIFNSNLDSSRDFYCILHLTVYIVFYPQLQWDSSMGLSL